jgi:hypothetical protein
MLLTSTTSCAASAESSFSRRFPTVEPGLTGKTWYRHQIGPQVYWELWLSAIIGRIHSRVFEHVKDHAEVVVPDS